MQHCVDEIPLLSESPPGTTDPSGRKSFLPSEYNNTFPVFGSQ